MSERQPPWTVSEVNTLLGLILSKYSVDRIDGRGQRNRDIFMRLERDFKAHGKHKNWMQIRVKWKTLKRSYYKCAKRVKGQNDPKEPWLFFHQMHDLLTNPQRRLVRNVSNVRIGKVVLFPHTIIDNSQALNKGNKDEHDEDSGTDPILISIKGKVTDKMPSSNEGIEVDEAADDVSDSLEDKDEEDEDSDTDQILRSIKEEGTDEISSLSERSESEENDQEDSDIDQILRTIKEEGEKDRQTTIQAVQVLANAMKESIDKLIYTRDLT